MASTINAKTTGVGGIDASGDASGVLALQTGGTTAVTIDASQNVGIASTVIRANLAIGTSGAGSAGDANKIRLYDNNGTTIYGFGISGGQLNYVTPSDGSHVFYSNSLARMYVSNTGDIFAGNTATQNGATAPVYSKTTAKAWVTFTGSTGAILSSFNVSSVTRVTVGFYTINFTSAMPNANYSSFFMAQPTVTNSGSDTFCINPSTTAVDARHYEIGVNRDSAYSCFVAFGSA